MPGAFRGNATSAQIYRETSAEFPGDDPCFNDFAPSAGDFKNSYEIFLKEPTCMSTAVLRYFERVYHEGFNEVWEMELKERKRV